MPDPAFNDHLERLRGARRRAEAVLELACPGYSAAEASLGLAWEALFELFCEETRPGLPELNTLSAVIHKLVGAFTQLKTLEVKIRDAEMKEAEFQAKRRQLEQTIASATTKPEGISPETLREIERRLQLL